jgi:hypothetical protein
MTRSGWTRRASRWCGAGGGSSRWRAAPPAWSWACARAKAARWRGWAPEEVSQWITLEPLGPQESAQVSRALLGELPAELQARLHALSEGNTFLLGALARGLAQHGAAHGWSRLDLEASEALAWLNAPNRGAQLLQGLLEELPEHGAALLEAAALLGRSFDVAAAARMRGLPRRVALRIFREAQERHLLHLEDNDRATFAHCKLREAALQRLGEGARREMHAEIARDLVAQGGADPFEVSWHYHAAGLDAEARPYALQAAAQAHARGALAQCVEHLEIAWAGSAGATRAQRQELAQVLGARVAARGDYPQARRWLEEARALADTAEARLGLDIQRGEVAFKDNDSVLSRRLLEGALRQLGARVPRRAAGFVVVLLWQLAWRAVWRVARGVAPTRGPVPPALARQVEVRRVLSYAYNFLNDHVAGLASLFTMLNQLERYEAGPALVGAKIHYTYICLIMGRGAAAAAAVEEARQIAALRRDREVIARVHQVAALVYYTQGALERAWQEGSQAAALHERFGEHWDFNLTLYSLGMAQVGLGLHGDALKTGLRLFQRATQADEVLMIIAGVVLLQRASGLRLAAPAAALEGLHARYDSLDAQQQSALLRCMALEALRRGALEEAMALSARAQPIIHKLGLEYTADGIDAHVEIARRRWEQQREAAPSQRLQREAQWAEALRAAERFARQHPVHQPATQRERAWWWAWRGDSPRARAALGEALARAEALKMAGELALTRMARAQIGAMLGWPEARAELAQARALLQSVRPPQEQLDRVQALLSQAAGA